MKKMTITDAKGRKTEITDEGTYTVIFKDRRGNPQIDTGVYLNYPHDGYIGHDDCEGRGAGNRYLVDGAEDDYLFTMKREDVLAVIPEKEFMKKVLELFI